MRRQRLLMLEREVEDLVEAADFLARDIDLPASELLLKRGTIDGQVVHALCHLGDRAIRAGVATPAEILSDGQGIVHAGAHWLHLGPPVGVRDPIQRLARVVREIEGRLR